MTQIVTGFVQSTYRELKIFAKLFLCVWLRMKTWLNHLYPASNTDKKKTYYNQFYRNNKCSTFDWKTTVHLRSMWIKMTHFNCAQLTFHPNSFSCLVVPRSNVAHFSNPGRYLLPAPMGDGWSWGKFIRRLHNSFSKTTSPETEECSILFPLRCVFLTYFPFCRDFPQGLF